MVFGFKKKTTDSAKPEVKKEKKAAVKEVKKEKIQKEEIKKIFKKNPELTSRILIKPLITEKATNLGVENKYIFEVSSKANKIEVKKAIQSLYGVEPIKVNIINMGGKEVRYGKTQGQTKNIKKAIVTLKEGDKIDIFEK